MSVTGAAVATIVVDEIAAAEDFAARIGAAWQKSVEAIFETGRLIAEAKEALPHGDFTAMIETQLPFGARTAQMLMKVATDQRLTNPKHVSHLPPSWGTLYELTKLDDDTLARRISEGTIRPDMQRRDVATGGARSIMASREQSAESLDFFPTPPWATRALIEVVLPQLGQSLEGCTVQDPACGEGHMTGVFLEYPEIGKVVGTDIKDYGRGDAHVPGFAGCVDFLDVRNDVEADWIVTNPPFGDKTLDFALAALNRARRGVALFVRQQWLEGIDRYHVLFGRRPPTLYAQFAERVNLCEGKWDPYGSTATAYCWLIWVRDMAPQPPLWIPPGQRKQFHYADDVDRFTAHPVIAPDGPDPLMGEVMAMAKDITPPPADNAAAPTQFKSTPETDAIIRAGYGAEPFDLDALAASLGATKLQVRRRANQLGLGSRDRQREAVARANAARGGAA